MSRTGRLSTVLASTGWTRLRLDASAISLSTRSRRMTRRRLGGLVLVLACACSSARMDRNTGTVSWSPPPPMPLVRPSASSSAAPAPEKAPPGVASAVPAESSAHINPPAPAVCSSLPDPAPITTDRWVKLQVRLDRGKLHIVSHSPEPMRRGTGADRPLQPRWSAW